MPINDVSIGLNAFRVPRSMMLFQISFWHLRKCEKRICDSDAKSYSKSCDMDTLGAWSRSQLPAAIYPLQAEGGQVASVPSLDVEAAVCRWFTNLGSSVRGCLHVITRWTGSSGWSALPAYPRRAILLSIKSIRRRTTADNGRRRTTDDGRRTADFFVHTQ